MLEIKLGRLKHDSGFSQPVELTAPCNPLDYGYADMQLCAPLVFSGIAENQNGEIQVRGQLKTALALVCSRCGEEFSLPLELPFAELYSAQKPGPDEQGEQDKHGYGGEAIDIMPEALRLLFEELPMKPLCREDCRGLCPSCGADLNKEECACTRQETDPRWEKLRALLQDDSGKGV